MHAATLTTLAVAILTVWGPCNASADTTAGILAAIGEAADRICVPVAQSGHTTQTAAKGNVQAGLSWLTRRLADLNLTGTGEIASTEYQGLLQNDLAATLGDIRKCKLHVFESLQRKLLPDVSPSGTLPSLRPPLEPVAGSPTPFGFQTMCRQLAPAANVQDILDRFGQQAMADAPIAFVAPTKEPVTVTASVGGADDGGVLAVNARVHVLCMADANFAVVKEENGSHEGVVARRALRKP